MDIGKIQRNLDIWIYQCIPARVRTRWPNPLLTLHTQRLSVLYADSSLDRLTRNQSSTKACLENHCQEITADLQLLMGQKTEKWKVPRLSEKCTFWDGAYSLEGLPLFYGSLSRLTAQDKDRRESENHRRVCAGRDLKRDLKQISPWTSRAIQKSLGNACSTLQ